MCCFYTSLNCIAFFQFSCLGLMLFFDQLHIFELLFCVAFFRASCLLCLLLFFELCCFLRLISWTELPASLPAAFFLIVLFFNQLHYFELLFCVSCFRASCLVCLLLFYELCCFLMLISLPALPASLPAVLFVCCLFLRMCWFFFFFFQQLICIACFPASCFFL